MVLVLPVPGPAITIQGVLLVVMAWSCSLLKVSLESFVGGRVVSDNPGDVIFFRFIFFL